MKTEPGIKNWSIHLFQTFLLLLILTGLLFRFSWVNWSQGANLHPDEYGLTNTLTQLSIPKNLTGYFNTRMSSLSSYPRYDEQGQKIADGPDNGMRWGQWPMTIIRFVAEQTGNTGYNELRLTGRSLTALADSISILLIFLIGMRLYSRMVGLLASALSSLAVLQIQQSHFMTVDNFAVVFSMLALYACICLAQRPCAYRPEKKASVPGETLFYQADLGALGWYLTFGISLGMALASKINLLPLAGLVFVAGWIGIADLRLHYREDLWRIGLIWGSFITLAFLFTLLTFRITQPMSFRNPTGDTTFLSFHFNPDWVDNLLRAQNESNGVGGGPPGDQWAHRTMIVFPWINMVLWGLGLPLGLMAWGSLAWATWKMVRFGDRWRAHLIPLTWTGGYFFFMATRWVKSIRYFLPVYPWLALFAAWGIIELWQWAANQRFPDKNLIKRPSLAFGLKRVLSFITISIVISGTFAWALSFVRAIYLTDHTRVQATRWILEEIPGPFHLAILGDDGEILYQPVAAPDGLMVSVERPFIQAFTARYNGRLSGIILPHAGVVDSPGLLKIQITTDTDAKNVIDQAGFEVNSTGYPGAQAQQKFQGGQLTPGVTYYLVASIDTSTPVLLNRTIIANESWDEGLPFPFEGYDPFGQLYRGLTMEVRWNDDENKRKMFVDTLSLADYIILPSQRGIWTTCRIPKTYPMTMEYYRGLFSGHLGFELVASFSSPLRIGPLVISDLGGTIAWNKIPPLPLFNHSQLAAEEAFSVYDHPPVWIFKKRADYDQEAVKKYFEAIDLSKVVIESPRDASLSPCP